MAAAAPDFASSGRDILGAGASDLAGFLADEAGGFAGSFLVDILLKLSSAASRGVRPQ